MLAPLRLRKKRRSLFSSPKGFSSIAGAIFAVLVIFSLVSVVFVWSLSENTLYNNTLRQNQQADMDRLNENIVANVTCLSVNSTTVQVNGTLQNDGSISVQVITLWVTDSTQSTSGFKNSLNMVLKPGNVTTLSDSTAINVSLANSRGDIFTCWFISGRGKTVSINPLFGVNTANNITYANVSQGIGLVAFDFKAFSNIDCGSNAPANHTLLGAFQNDYALHQDHYVVFHVTLTAFDPSGNDLVLNGSSAIYILAAQGGTVKFGFWNLVNVTSQNGSLYINTALTPIYVLKWGVPVDVYFGGKPNISSPTVPQVYPLNIMVFGKLGSGDYGQNVPFVSMNLLS